MNFSNWNADSCSNISSLGRPSIRPCGPTRDEGRIVRNGRSNQVPQTSHSSPLTQWMQPLGGIDHALQASPSSRSTRTPLFILPESDTPRLTLSSRRAAYRRVRAGMPNALDPAALARPAPTHCVSPVENPIPGKNHPPTMAGFFCRISGVASSNAWDACSTRASSQGGPTIWIDTGRPSSLKPDGAAMVGKPKRL